MGLPGGDPQTAANLEQLKLTPPELFFVWVLAGVYGATVAELANLGLAPQTSTVVEIDGVRYGPNTGLARVLLASMDDQRFHEAPVQDWIARLQDWILKPMAREGSVAGSTRP
jgi:hypothetical protein